MIGPVGGRGAGGAGITGNAGDAGIVGGAGITGIAGGAVAVAAVALNAVVQAALVASDATPDTRAGFVLAGAGSLAAVVLAIWVVSGAFGGRILRARLLATSIIVVVLAAACGVITPPLALLPLLLGMFVVPAAAANTQTAPLRLAGRALRSSPARSAVAIIAALLLLLLSWGVAFTLGFFVTGWPAAAATWLWFGLSGVVMLRAGTTIIRSAMRGSPPGQLPGNGPEPRARL